LRRGRRRRIIGVTGGHVAKAAKALVVSKPIVIFHPRDEKS